MIDPKKYKTTYREVAKQLAQYLDEEYDDAFYLRIYRILKGEHAAPEREQKAIDQWLYNQDNPHKAGAFAYRMKDVPFDVMERYMLSGIFNTTKVRGMFKKISQIRKILH